MGEAMSSGGRPAYIIMMIQIDQERHHDKMIAIYRSG